MSTRLFAGTLAVAILSAPCIVLAGDDDQASREQIVSELEALREQVRLLEQKQSAQQTKLDAREVDATVEEVLRDADRRSQLLQAQGFTAGWSKGRFLIQSEDGRFVLNPYIWTQIRYVTNYREEDAPNSIDGDATTEHGLELRWMKLGFEGRLYEKLKYRFQWNTLRTNGNLTLDDAFITYALSDSMAIKAGQYRDPTFHEELTEETRQLAVDRSLVNFVLGGGNLDRVQGVAMVFDDGEGGRPFRAEVGFTDGPNSDNTNFVDGGGGAGGSGLFDLTNPDFGVYARGEYLAMGEWANYEDFTSLGTIGSMLVVGAGVSYAEAGDAQVILHTLDAQYEVGPVSLYGAYLGVYADSEVADGSTYDAGLLFQAGWLLDTKWEVFGRYEHICLDTARGPADDDRYQAFTAGVNYYLKRHNAKLSVDVVYLPDGTPVNADPLGILDPDADGDQFVLRGQFQLML